MDGTISAITQQQWYCRKSETNVNCNPFQLKRKKYTYYAEKFSHHMISIFFWFIWNNRKKNPTPALCCLRIGEQEVNRSCQGASLGNLTPGKECLVSKSTNAHIIQCKHAFTHAFSFMHVLWKKRSITQESVERKKYGTYRKLMFESLGSFCNCFLRLETDVSFLNCSEQYITSEKPSPGQILCPIVSHRNFVNQHLSEQID